MGERRLLMELDPDCTLVETRPLKRQCELEEASVGKRVKLRPSGQTFLFAVRSVAGSRRNTDANREFLPSATIHDPDGA
jgi:hypothetical protein